MPNLKESVKALIKTYGADTKIEESDGTIMTLEEYLSDRVDDRADRLDCRMDEERCLRFQLSAKASGPIFSILS